MRRSVVSRHRVQSRIVCGKLVEVSVRDKIQALVYCDGTNVFPPQEKWVFPGDWKDRIEFVFAAVERDLQATEVTRGPDALVA
ncbi:hypothetical protein [Rhodococcus qingshengii]|uniref:hypothetical protein n=1 Tax=Rhodococcus qingshengii TaxID=334542 RepID=UPI0035E2AD2F